MPFKTGNLRDERNPDVAVMLTSQIKFHQRTLAEVIEEELVRAPWCRCLQATTTSLMKRAA